MSATQKFIRFPFAVAGDRAAVPDPTDPTGLLSYQQGFGFDYQRAQTDPAVKNIPRQSWNQVMYDLSLGIQQYQLNGFPEFVQSADNGGVSLAYNAGAVVLWTDGLFYQSLVPANTALPTDSTKWGRVTLQRGKLAILSNSSWVVPAGVYLAWLWATSGGGGGGGGAGQNGAANQSGGGGGGGAGQSVIRLACAVTPGQTVNFTIGAGGVAGAAGAAGANGGNGGGGGNTLVTMGATTFANLAGGSGGIAGSYGGGGPGGGAGTGYPNGSCGDDGSAYGGGGAGASGPYGGGGGRARGASGTPVIGSDGYGYGSGGGGGGACYQALVAAGGHGGAGMPGAAWLEF